MPLVYGTNFTNYKPLPELKEKKPSGLTSFFQNLGKHLLNAARFLIDFVVDEIVANALALIPGIGLVARTAIKAVIGFASETIQDLIFDGKVDWKSMWWRLGLRIVGIGKYVFRALRKSSKFVKKLVKGKVINRLIRTASDTRGLYKNGFRHLLQIIKRESFKGVFKTLGKQKLKVSFLSRLPKFIQNRISDLGKLVRSGIKVIRFVTNPIKGSINAISRRISKALKRSINKVFQKLKVRSLIKTKGNENILRKLKKDFKNKVVLNSSWIYGLKVFQQEQWDLSQNITYTIYFDWQATKTSKNKGKLPIVRWEAPYKEFIGWLKASSPGDYYLNEIAWGWQIKNFLGKETIYLSAKEAKNDLKSFGNLKNVLHKIEDPKHYQQKWNEAVTPNSIKRRQGARGGRVTGNVYPTFYSNVPNEIKLAFPSKHSPFDFTNKTKIIGQKITRYKFKGGRK